MPPKILATRNLIYCAGACIKIVTNVTVPHDPFNPSLFAIYIQISSGYVFDEDLLTLTDATLLPNMPYLWSTTETTQQTMISQTGNYTVAITSFSPENCTTRKNIKVIENKIPKINIVEVDQTTAVINLKNPQNYYEYSIDSINYQSSNVFSAVSSGLQIAFVRDKH
jgi:hypothetical protein